LALPSWPLKPKGQTEGTTNRTGKGQTKGQTPKTTGHAPGRGKPGKRQTEEDCSPRRVDGTWNHKAKA